MTEQKNPIARTWGRVSTSLMPVLAVVTALIAIIPLMILFQGEGNIGRGFQIAGQAYSGLIEGSVGLAFNEVLDVDDVSFALEYVQRENENNEDRIAANDINILAQRAEELARIGRDNVLFYAAVIDQYYEIDALPDNRAFDELGNLVPEIRRVGEARLRNYSDLILTWSALSDLNIRDIAEQYAEAITPADRAFLVSLVPDLAEVDDATLRGTFQLLAERPLPLVLTQYRNLQAGEEITPLMEQIGVENLETYGPVVAMMESLSSVGPISVFLNTFESVEDIDIDIRQRVEQFIPLAANYNDDDLMDALRLLRERGINRLSRAYEQLLVLDEIGLSPLSDEADAIAAIHEETTNVRDPNGVEIILRIAEADQRFQAAGIAEDDIDRLAYQLRLTANLYGDVLSRGDVESALTEELPEVLQVNDVILRPNNQVLVLQTEQTIGLIEGERTLTTPTINEDGARTNLTEQVVRPDFIYVDMGSRYLLFFPDSLEQTLMRSLPFIIAGLAVALGFKAGLFNIGAEGQLYIGATLAAWIGFSPLFDSLPGLLHVPLVLIGGLIGGALWGLIPGLLKAYTGAHEVINTIMLNFIAIRLTDWLIKSTDPIILRDPVASAPQTPLLDFNARLTTFDDVAPVFFIVAGVLFGLFSAWSHREAIQKNTVAIIRPIVYGLLVTVGGFVLQWLTVSGNLHIGLVVMVLSVLFVDWFLNRTTIGFELRTVGTNPDAAKYAGMNVKLNIALAMTLSGALAGLAGIVEIGGVQYVMEPEFFSGLGFDAIAVALLARNNPRNMIPAPFEMRVSASPHPLSEFRPFANQETGRCRECG